MLAKSLMRARGSAVNRGFAQVRAAPVAALCTRQMGVRTFLMKTRSVNVPQQAVLAQQSVRCFSEAPNANEYETVSQENWYTPTGPVQFSGKSLTVFDADATKERRFAPWEVKEATIKNSFGLLSVYMFDAVFSLGQGYAAAQAFFCINYARSVWNLMGSAVTKMALLDNGKQVELTFGRASGATVVVNIKDIKKLAHEKTLVETFEESSMFPIQVGKETYYIHGQGQECIKHGEVFRAIINGQSIKV